MEEESNNPELGTAIDVNEAASLISNLDMSEDSIEQPEEHVEQPTTEADENEAEVVETPEDQFIEIDGEQVSLTDLRNGYLRQQDYTRKTQEIAEERRQYRENQRDVNALRSEALQNIEEIKKGLSIQFQTMEQPDFDWLAQNDPAEFIRQQHIWQQRENHVRQLWEAEQHLRKQSAEFEAEQHKAALQESHTRFLEKYPEMSDRAKSEEAFSEITQYLLDTGFTKEEIQSVSDYRIIDILYQNVQLQKAQKKVPEVVAKMDKKPVLSAKQPSSKPDFNRSKVEQFNKTRSVNDAAALIKNLL